VAALAVLAACAVAFALWVIGTITFLRANPRADELHRVPTGDGWRIALSRYCAVGPVRNYPVLLCHGLASNRVAFDLAPEVSLARSLARDGFDVWSLELRGHGRSDHACFLAGRHYRWTFDDYVLKDVPAAIAFVKAQTGRARLHWIGHSMGGILLYAHLARGGSGDLCSGTALGSSIDYSESRSGFRRFLGLRWLAEFVGPLPIGPLSFLAAPLAGRFGTAIERFNYWPENLEPRLQRRVSASFTHTTSSRVLAQLASAFESGGLRSADGSVHYKSGLRTATAPVLAVAGDHDRQCPPEAAEATVAVLGSAERRLVVLGPAHGCAEHYGHFDIIVGRHAPTEVYPLLYDWLHRHDATVPS
jgi:pimeloyl-ACP methyl ester carboxylesterase